MTVIIAVVVLGFCFSLRVLWKMRVSTSSSWRLTQQAQANKATRLNRLREPNPIVGPGYPPAHVTQKAKSGVAPAPPPRPLVTVTTRSLLGSLRPTTFSMDRRYDLATSALMECVNCRREVEAFHLDCDACFEEHPNESPLQRCEHYECRRCGQEI